MTTIVAQMAAIVMVIIGDVAKANRDNVPGAVQEWRDTSRIKGWRGGRSSLKWWHCR